MHLSLYLVIDVIDFLSILESNIYHNQSDFLIHLTYEIMKHHFGELTTYSQGVQQLYPGKVCCSPFLRYQHSLLKDPLYNLTLC